MRRVQTKGVEKALLGKGNRNEFVQFCEDLRDRFVDSGFSEVFLPNLVLPDDVKTQYGYKFFQNGFLGVSKSARDVLPTGKRDDKIRRIIPDVSDGTLSRINSVLDDYSNGDINAFGLVNALVDKAGLLPDQALKVADSCLQLKWGKVENLIAMPLNAWFRVASGLIARYPAPRGYVSLSLLDEKIERPTISGILYIGKDSGDDQGNEEGITSALFRIISDVLSSIDVPVERREGVPLPVFVPGTFANLFSRNKKIGYVGQLSFTSLEHYGISEPIFYFELDLFELYSSLGKEPLVSLRPEFYGEWVLSDDEIASKIRKKESPKTEMGKEIMNAILKTVRIYANQPTPCEFKVFEKEFEDRALQVWVVGYEKSLVGPGFDNDLYVYKGSILALPTTGDHEALISGKKVGIKVGEALAAFVASHIEADPRKEREFRFDTLTLDNANLSIPRQVLDYIRHIGGDIKIEVPVFFKVETRIRKLWVYKKES